MWLAWSVSVSLLLLAGAGAFPESQDPFSAGPHMSVADRKPCQVTLFENATLNTYSTVYRFPFQNHCLSAAFSNNGRHWDRVVLHVRGHVAGVQYDRVGALWMNGVEVMRLTTPEPTTEGISWQVERDVTDYASLFVQPGQVQLQIPNNVNDIYTGIIFLSAYVSFYPLSSSQNNKNPMADIVLSLVNPTQHADAWSSMAIRGSDSQMVNLTALGSLWTRPSCRAHIDLYASAHGCEEFWYTNPPDSLAKQNGMCGGGSTRVIQLLIDGQVAGIQLPFPVVYTGGINPLLWRPQTGIYSFNIPPYIFDISPFLEVLSDGKQHTMQVKILGNSVKGEWNLDPVLVIFNQHDDASSASTGAVSGSDLSRDTDRYHFFQTGPITRVIIGKPDSNNNGTNNITWTEEMKAELVIETTIAGKSTRVSSMVSSFITNSLIGDNVQVTSAELTTWLNSSAYNRAETLEYPLFVSTFYQTGNHSFVIDATIHQQLRNRIVSGNDAATHLTTTSYTDSIMANATYSRSTDPDRTVYAQRGCSTQKTLVAVNNMACFQQHITAEHGFVASFLEIAPCTLPATLCYELDVCSPVIVNASKSTSSATPNAMLQSISKHHALLVRHPKSALTGLRHDNLEVDDAINLAAG
jgi:Peptide N-acetyl-beta-D-glucosaminyl asparaginase amidase A